MRIHDWLGHGRAHVGQLRMEIKHVNHKTFVHQTSEADPMKQRQVLCTSMDMNMCGHIMCRLAVVQFLNLILNLGFRDQVQDRKSVV